SLRSPRCGGARSLQTSGSHNSTYRPRRRNRLRHGWAVDHFDCLSSRRHEDRHEGHEAMTLSRARSTVPQELDALAERVIGMCLAVHDELGPGMNESIYVRACQLEFEANGVSYDSERAVPIRYHGRL